MKMKRSFSDTKLFDVLLYTILALVLIAALYPLWYVAIASISSPSDIVSGNVLFLPVNLSSKAYERVFRNSEIWVGYRNAILYTFVGTLTNVSLTTMLAYPLSRPYFFGKKAVIAFVTFTMFFNGGMIPTYLLVKNLGLLDSMWAVILPTAVSTWNLFIMRTFFQTSIPDALVEAAEIDGAGHIQILCKIVLPLSKSIMGVMVLFYAVVHWNAYFEPMIYLSSNEKFPLQVILRDILLMSKTSMMMESVSEGTLDQALLYEAIKYAVIVIASIPLLIIYPFVQKYFVKGVMIGAVKG